MVFAGNVFPYARASLLGNSPSVASSRATPNPALCELCKAARCLVLPLLRGPWPRTPRRLVYTRPLSLHPNRGMTAERSYATQIVLPALGGCGIVRVWYCQLKNGPSHRFKNGPQNHSVCVLSLHINSNNSQLCAGAGVSTLRHPLGEGFQKMQKCISGQGPRFFIKTAPPFIGLS